jgi:ribonuclease E
VETTDPEPGPDQELEAGPEPELEPELEPLAQAFEQLTHPEAEEKLEPPAMPVEQHVGREQLTRLRARYAEMLARIAERGGDAERIEALRAQAESLNPDAWVTDAEVREGVEAFEPRIRDLRAALGLRRRRRSRRGGRRRRGGGEGGDGTVGEGTGGAAEGGTPPQAEEPEPQSNEDE